MNLAHLLKQKIPPDFYQRILFLSQTCARSSLKPYLVGGVVRDLILLQPIKNELDITIEGGELNSLAHQLSRKWSAKLISYPQFLTFTLEFAEGSSLDLITTRKEQYPFPASLPVVRRGSLRDDLARRDFSINAMAVSIAESNWGEFFDFFNGLSDIKKKQIKVLHRKSFQDDPTRIFRAAQFAGRFSFVLERKTAQWLKQSIARQDILKLSSDRIRNELEKILLEEKAASSLALLASWRAVNQIHPLLKWKFSKSFQRTFDSLSLQTSRHARKSGHPVTLQEEQMDSPLQGNDNQGGKDDLKVVRLALWLNHFPRWEVQQILQELKFTKQMQEKILDLTALRSELSAGTGERDRKLEQNHFLYVQALLKIKGKKELKKKWEDYQKWLGSVPQINGEDLKKAGIQPGPVYKKIFGAIRKAKFKGKLKTKQEELRFAIDNFRRD